MSRLAAFAHPLRTRADKRTAPGSIHHVDARGRCSCGARLPRRMRAVMASVYAAANAGQQERQWPPAHDGDHA